MKLIETAELPSETEVRNRRPFVLGVDEVVPAALKPAQKQTAENKSFLQQISILMLVFVLSMGSYYMFSRFCISTVQVSGRSMTPTLYDGDRYVLNRLSFLYREPQISEIVVLRDPGHSDYAVKRIIAGPGDAIFFDHGKVIVNGKELQESYLAPFCQTQVPPSHPKQFVLGKDQYFVLGDNRSGSEDSRYYGPIKKDHIVGPIWK
jgi:signal peptidase I